MPSHCAGQSNHPHPLASPFSEGDTEGTADRSCHHQQQRQKKRSDHGGKQSIKPSKMKISATMTKNLLLVRRKCGKSNGKLGPVARWKPAQIQQPEIHTTRGDGNAANPPGNPTKPGGNFAACGPRSACASRGPKLVVEQPGQRPEKAALWRERRTLFQIKIPHSFSAIRVNFSSSSVLVHSHTSPVRLHANVATSLGLSVAAANAALRAALESIAHDNMLISRLRHSSLTRWRGA